MLNAALKSGLRRTACFWETRVNTNLALKQVHNIINLYKVSIHDREKEKAGSQSNEAGKVKTAPNTVAFSSSTRTASGQKGQI